MHSRIVAGFVLGLLALSFVAVDVAGAVVSSSSSSSTQAAVSSSTSTTKTTTTETLSSMTTNKVYDTTDVCFQGQAQGGNTTVRYVFKPSGFMYWQNKAGGNFTITGYTVGVISTGTSTPKANSTALDYTLSNPGFSAHIFLKNVPSGCANLPGNTFKITISGTATSPTTLTMNLGNPNNQKVTCDNINHIITYGVTGINFTDSIAFGANCTTTTISFNIPIGSFKIDPSTVSSTSAANAIRTNIQNKAWWIPSLSLYVGFYSDGTNLACRTSTDGTTWSSASTIVSSIGSSTIDFWFSGATLYYIRTSGNAFQWRYGTFSSGCSMSWTISDTSINTVGTSAVNPSTVVDSSGNLWASVVTTQAGNSHTEVWKCPGAVSTCTWAESKDYNSGAATQLSTDIVADSTFIGVISGISTGSQTANIFYSTDGGTTWSTTYSNNCILTGPRMKAVALGAKIWAASAPAAGASYCSFDTSTQTYSTPRTVVDANGADAIMTTDNTNLYFIWTSPVTPTILYLSESFDSGAVFSFKISLATGQTFEASNLVSSALVSGKMGIEWENSAANTIRFQNVTIPVLALAQEKTVTFTAQSSPTAQFSNSVAAGNIVYVIASDSVAADTVSSVTDSGSNTYYFITRQNSLSTVGNVEGWYSITTTGGTLTITVNLGISLSGAIILNEIGSARNDRPLSSIGTGTGTATSVTSYSPDANSLVIGGLNSGCLTACTVTAGTSYTLDDNAAVSTLFQASSEHITNTGTAETTPFALSASSGWNEISVAFAPPASPVAETATLSQTVSITPTLSRVFAGIRSLNAPISINAIVNMICPQADCIQRIVSGQIFGSFIIASIVIGFMMIGLMAARRKRR